ncbi:histidine phosphatase family protein [Paenibacillus anaericanus]|uniref:Histidine phosphatase family protein n=1 Tax=Paenibacillus anaericanus TaxID=170367 RepID=A0A3S1BPK0_9BACL|nr:histidine phosphatase family protein [Paenibacillus anaericanus]RUT44458.1 histidine phosphatase family protein [Paenibacillus anaericanus]
MNTYIYMVRHGESLKTEGNERTRGLTDKGKTDAHIIAELLKDEGINTFVSSPYSRASLTIENLAHSLGKEIVVFEDLREIDFSSDDKILDDKEVYPAVRKMFADPDFSLPGGESITTCQKRSITTLKQILREYKGQKVVLGTHGAVMTLMMGYFDSQYDLDFLFKTSKPDIYRMEFDGEVLRETKRLWQG